MAFFLVHGWTSYTRWGSDAVNPLVGDVVGVTEVQGCGLLRDSGRRGRRFNSNYSGLTLQCCDGSWRDFH